MRERRTAIGLLVLSLAACQPAVEPRALDSQTATGEAPEAKPALPAGHALVGGLEVGIEISQPLRALGTEPFWGVEIEFDELVFSGVDRPEARMANPGPSLQEGNFVIAARDTDGQTFTLTMREVQCSDGMSDRVYPLEAEVQYKGETLKGCASSQAALDALPPP
jgi:uncharacterized membrane protein